MLQEFSRAKQRGAGMLKNHVSNISTIPTRSHNAPPDQQLTFGQFSHVHPVSACAKGCRLLRQVFLRHVRVVRPSIVRIDLSPLRKPHMPNLQQQSEEPGVGLVIYMGDAATAVACLAKTVSDLEGPSGDRWVVSRPRPRPSHLAPPNLSPL